MGDGKQQVHSYMAILRLVGLVFYQNDKQSVWGRVIFDICPFDTFFSNPLRKQQTENSRFAHYMAILSLVLLRMINDLWLGMIFEICLIDTFF